MSERDEFLERPPAGGHEEVRDGVPTGTWTWTGQWDDDVIQRSEIVDGRLHGETIRFHDAEKVQSRGHYTHGRKTGTWRGWDWDQQLEWEADYDDDGVLTELRKRGDNGKTLKVVDLSKPELGLPILDEGVARALDPDVVQELRIDVGFIGRIPAALSRLRRLERLDVDNCTILDFAPEALHAGTKKLKFSILYCTHPESRLFGLLLEHGFGTWQLSIWTVDGPSNDLHKPLKPLGNEFVGDLPARKRALALLPSGPWLAERQGIEGVALPKVAGAEELALADVAKAPLRDAALDYLERAWPNPLKEHPLGADATLFLMGKAKAYPKGELEARLEERGWEVAKKAEKATHAVLMGRPKQKLAQALAAKLPILLEPHLRDVLEADAPVLVEDGSEQEHNLEQMLDSPDPATVQLAVQLLQRGALPTGLLPELVALMLFNPDKSTRDAVKALVLAKADRALADFFDGDRRNYTRLTDGGKLRRLVKDLARHGLDAATFSRAMVRQCALLHESSLALEGVLLAALEQPGSGPLVFPMLATRHDLWLSGLKPKWPTGISSAAAVKELYVSRCKFEDDTDELAKLSKLRELRLSYCTLGKGISCLDGCASLERLELDGTELRDFTPLSALSSLKWVTLTGTGIADLEPVRPLGQLIGLQLAGCPVDDVSVVAELPKLQYLRLSQTRVRDLEPLRGLEHLRVLELDETSVADLSPIAGLTNLTELSLRNTAVTDLSALTGMTKLRSLQIHQTKVEDLSPLDGLQSLEYVYTSGSAVPKNEVTRLQKVLKKARVMS